MFKQKSFYAVSVLFAAMIMTSGCSTQDIVKKDEGILQSQVTNKTDQSESDTTPAKQNVISPASQDTPAQTPAPNQQASNLSSTSQLQSALEKIYFDFDSANLSESARNTLTKNAAALKKEPSVKIVIEGNCDERGSAEYNLALGERRAKSAQQYLTTLGVKPDRLSVVSYGKEKPAIKGSDEDVMAKNRRDEFVVVAK